MAGLSRICDDSVACAVHTSDDGFHGRTALYRPCSPAAEQKLQEDMRRLQHHYASLCRKHMGQSPPRQSFDRWLMERSIRHPDSSGMPSVLSADEVSPCMHRELSNAILSVPANGSGLNDYKFYFSSVKRELEKRTEKCERLSTLEAGVLLNKLPACMKLIEISGSPTGAELLALVVNCKQLVKALKPIVDKVIFSEVDDVCRGVSSYVFGLNTRKSNGWESPPVDDDHEITPSCSPAVTWNDEVGRACRAAVPPFMPDSAGPSKSTRPTAISAHSHGESTAVRPGGAQLSTVCTEKCTERTIRVPAGRGWSKGARADERRRQLARLQQANGAPCNNCRTALAAVPHVTCNLSRDGAISSSNLVTVSTGGMKCSIAEAHFQKLERLYKATCAQLDPELAYFRERLLCMLKRYETLLGDMSAVNLQGALPVAAFHCLHVEFGVTMECFASPLNCYFPQYCSLYANTDSVFGSRGSFFSFRPVEGSLAANPPFCEEVIERMVDHMEALLSATERPLSFNIVIPEWREPPTRGAVKMDRSKFLRSHSVLPARDHVYRSGKQHLITSTRQLNFTASFGTEVFFLQNEAGKRKWPVTDAKMDALRKAFAAPDSESR
eukprot:scpid53179/ scgid2600/ Phosphorylated CTD-interacting factor 1